MRLLVLAALLIGWSAGAQGRPFIARGGVGFAVPFGTAAEIWNAGPDAMLAITLPSWGRTALRFEGAYAKFPVDEAKLRDRHSLAPTDTASVRGGSREALTIMAILESYWSRVGECTGSVLPSRYYTLIGIGYAGIRNNAYTIVTSTTSFSAPQSTIGALALGVGIGAERPVNDLASLFVEARWTSWKEAKIKFDPGNFWMPLRIGIAVSF